MMKRLTKHPSVLLLSVVALLLLLFGMFAYRADLEHNLALSSCQSMDDILEQQRLAFTQKLREQQQVIKTYARFLQDPSLREDEIRYELNAVAENASFNYISYIDPAGNGVRNTGEHFQIADRDYFQRALAGATLIAGPVPSAVSGEPITTFSTPILHAGEVIGVLNGVYDFQYLSTILPPSFDGAGYTYVTNSVGEVIVSTQGDNPLSRYPNLFDALGTVEYKLHDDFNMIQQNIALRRAGHSHYEFNGENRFLHYAPLSINDWYIFTVVPESVIAEQSLLIMRSTTLLMLGACCIFLLLLLYFYREHRAHIRALSRIAYIDPLTGIYNKRRFALAAEELLPRGTPYALVLLDIDKFKVFNDTLGYAAGDSLLITIAEILREHARPNETFGRGDSDQFFVLLTYESDEITRTRIDAMLAAINDHFQASLGARSYRLVVCVGVYVIPDATESVNGMGDRAKHALQLVKDSQVSSIAFYNEEMRRQLLREKEIENHMHAALTQGEFLLYLQPKYRLSDETIYGAEALARWNYRSEVLITPNDFIPLFEKNGFITQLDMFMLEQTCMFLHRQLAAGVTPVPISINFSRLHLKNPDFVEEIAAVAARYAIPSHLLEVELTESTMHENEDTLIEVLEHLHQRGFTLSMDDFGSGYSSLGLLKNLPVDAVKLDRTFFTQYTDLARAKMVIANMLAMTRALQITTVAEGVETRESIDLLKELGCDIVQGFYFARPMEAEKIYELLETEGKQMDTKSLAVRNTWHTELGRMNDD